LRGSFEVCAEARAATGATKFRCDELAESFLVELPPCKEASEFEASRCEAELKERRVEVHTLAAAHERARAGLSAWQLALDEERLTARAEESAVVKLRHELSTLRANAAGGGVEGYDSSDATSMSLAAQLAEIKDLDTNLRAALLRSDERRAAHQKGAAWAQRRATSFREQLEFTCEQYAAAHRTISADLDRLRCEWQQVRRSESDLQQRLRTTEALAAAAEAAVAAVCAA